MPIHIPINPAKRSSTGLSALGRPGAASYRSNFAQPMKSGALGMLPGALPAANGLDLGSGSAPDAQAMMGYIKALIEADAIRRAWGSQGTDVNRSMTSVASIGTSTVSPASASSMSLLGGSTSTSGSLNRKF